MGVWELPGDHRGLRYHASARVAAARSLRFPEPSVRRRDAEFALTTNSEVARGGATAAASIVAGGGGEKVALEGSVPLSNHAGVLYRLLRPLLYRLDPERAHQMVLSVLEWTGATPLLPAILRAGFAPPAGHEVEAFGLTFPNPVGLAAGYDKDAMGWRGLVTLGFGHIEIGTVTPRPQPGNPRPRLFRLARDRALINRLGFPSRGAEHVASRLGGKRPKHLILGVNIGKQRETPLKQAADDYEHLMDRFAPLADYLAINISSPSTPELRRLQERDWLDPLLQRLTARKRELDEGLGRSVPLLVKLAPDLSDTELAQAVESALGAGVDGVIATNTTINREGLTSPRAIETGGLSGAPLTRMSTNVVRRIRQLAGDALPIVASGGVMNADDARAKLEAGACLVQVYSGLIYEGPRLVRRIVAGL